MGEGEKKKKGRRRREEKKEWRSSQASQRYGNQGFQTRPGVLTRGGERVKGSEVQPSRTGVQLEG